MFKCWILVGEGTGGTYIVGYQGLEYEEGFPPSQAVAEGEGPEVLSFSEPGRVCAPLVERDSKDDFSCGVLQN